MDDQRVAIIGAGPSGITAAKNCLEGGLEPVVFELNDRVGGNWVFDADTGHSSVYENTHIISSRAWSEYEDFPMPADYPEYPGHKQLQAYFENYTRHFGVLPHIRFRHRVSHVERQRDGQWLLHYEDDQGHVRRESFPQLMVCNGHHWDPKYPTYPGEFTGITMHSHDFKVCDDRFRSQRILVIGAGNSACDVAVETARVAEKVCLSMRRGQWFMPKYIFGQPSDVVAAKTRWAPAWLRKWLTRVLTRLMVGDYRKMGLPEPDTDPLEQHPTINSDLIEFVRHGKIHIRPAIERYEGQDVVFRDGTRETFDIVCACTGFKISFPFFDRSLIDFQDAQKVPLYRKMMHPDYPNLYFIGLFQPLGCIWPLADHQAKLAVAEIRGEYERPKDLPAAIQYELDHPHFNFSAEARHSVEVDYHGFRKDLMRELGKVRRRKQAGEPRSAAVV
ncbi:NAD(P)-binding domain-containing protein [Marinobacteraceae bacterium S3BR75-40.1]